jgi:hypothetical protein
MPGFSLHLTNKHCSPGDLITGYVSVWFETDVTTYGCAVELCGIEQTQRKGTKESVAFLSQKVLLGRDCGRGYAPYFRVQAGQHKWAFSFRLPERLPPSIAHPNGLCSILYEVRAELRNPPGAGGSKRTLQIVEVLSPPPALPSSSRTPVTCEIDKSFAGNANEPINVKCDLPANVLEAGELARLRISVDNASRKTIARLEIHLIRRWRYLDARDEQTLLETVLAPTEHFPLAARALFRATARVQLPRDLPPSVVTKSIACTYLLRVFVVVVGVLSSNVQLDVPFAVAAVPPQAPSSAHAGVPQSSLHASIVAPLSAMASAAPTARVVVTAPIESQFKHHVSAPGALQDQSSTSDDNVVVLPVPSAPPIDDWLDDDEWIGVSDHATALVDANIDALREANDFYQVVLMCCLLAWLR